MTRTIVTLVALAGIAFSSSGCALAVAGMAGYMIADHDKRADQVKACRANLQTTNQARLAKGLDAYPDMCGN